MNSLWPTVPRISCLNTRTIFRTCQQVDSLAARLAHGVTRTYSKASTASPQGLFRKLGQEQGRAIWRGSSPLNGLGLSIRTYASKSIVTRFDQLPPNYKDEDGLPFRQRPLLQQEARKMFENQVDADMANHILRVLHGRRVAGTLADPSLSMRSTSTRAVTIALAWLRKNVPVNEVECAGLRAEQELAEMEDEIVSDAERIGLYKPSPKGQSKTAKRRDIYAPNSTPTKNVYGESGLDKIRKDNLKRLDEKEAAAEANRQKQAQEINQNTGPLETISARSNVELRRPGENPLLKYYLERAKFLPEKPVEMSAIQRLWPSLLITLAVVLASLLFVEIYTPPKKSSRLWPDMPPSAATITGIVLINAATFVLWRFPPAMRFMNMNFMFYPGYPRPLALIGCMFSQQFPAHLAANMVTLWFVGTRLHDEIGRANFLAVFMSAGAIGGFTSLVYWTMKRSFVSSHLGASGAICGIIGCYLMLNSSEKVTLFGVFPPEGWPSISCMAALIVLLGMEIAGIRRRSKKITLDHWNHLGGYAGGIAAAQLIEMRIRRRKAEEKDRRKGMGFIDRVKDGRF